MTECPYAKNHTFAKIRDIQDRSRAASPLCQPESAWVIDTSLITVDEVVDQIVQRVQTDLFRG